MDYIHELIYNKWVITYLVSGLLLIPTINFKQWLLKVMYKDNPMVLQIRQKSADIMNDFRWAFNMATVIPVINTILVIFEIFGILIAVYFRIKFSQKSKV